MKKRPRFRCAEFLSSWVFSGNFKMFFFSLQSAEWWENYTISLIHIKWGLSHPSEDKKKWHCYIPEVLLENELNIKDLIVYSHKLKNFSFCQCFEWKSRVLIETQIFYRHWHTTNWGFYLPCIYSREVPQHRFLA